MKKVKNCIIIGPDEHRYANSYRLYCSVVPGDFKVGDLFSVEWHSIDDKEKALAIFFHEETKFRGVNKVDKKGRMNFTPPDWIFPKIQKEKKVNYGKFNKGEFEFGGSEI